MKRLLNNLTRYNYRAHKTKSAHYGINPLNEILIISSYPPKICGLASYSNDLYNSLKTLYGDSIKISICGLSTRDEPQLFSNDIEYTLNCDDLFSYVELAKRINSNPNIKVILLQHEFGLFSKSTNGLYLFLKLIKKDVITTFHTILPTPLRPLKNLVRHISNNSKKIIVMTSKSAKVLIEDYNISNAKISVIPHGTHLPTSINKTQLKNLHNLKSKLVLTTFGLIGPGKNIETSILALPDIILSYPNTVFLILGKTHPNEVAEHGESYRNYLVNLVEDLKLEKHVIFIDRYLDLEELQNYLKLTDIYLFTSKDRHQAVSGTLSYAISSGCMIISTPIPHALEIITPEFGRIIEFESYKQLSFAVQKLLEFRNENNKTSLQLFEKMFPTAWENSALKHVQLIKDSCKNQYYLHLELPNINLNHLQRITTDFGVLQFSHYDKPDISSGYTLDDNARALVFTCQLFEKTKDKKLLILIETYFSYIKFCQSIDGKFYNYTNYKRNFTPQNSTSNLDDCQGYAIWALGQLVALRDILPRKFYHNAEEMINRSLYHLKKIQSPRAMAYITKGLYLQNNHENIYLVKLFAIRLQNLYAAQCEGKWNWFEDKLTYGNAILVESMIYAWKLTHNNVYKKIAIDSLEFLWSRYFQNGCLNVGANLRWYKNKTDVHAITKNTQQPIEVAYLMITLEKMATVFKNPLYLKRLNISFGWFMGNNHLHQIIYNLKTGGCHDGLERNNVNLNQGAESTICYLLARLCFPLSSVKKN